MVKAADLGVATISKETLNAPAEFPDSFLFRMSDDLKNEVLVLGTDKITGFHSPVLFGPELDDIEDTWGEARTGGRVHEGTDIMALKGDLIVSPVRAVVTNIGTDRLGGNFVITTVPGGEQFYYAHLTDAADNITEGSILNPGDLIGFVGNTGDAKKTEPHLHLGIYFNKVANNPYARLTEAFSLEDQMASLRKILATYDIAPLIAVSLVENHRDTLLKAQSQNLALPPIIESLLAHSDVLTTAQLLTKKIVLGAENKGVHALQEFLIDVAKGPKAAALAKKGATGYFGDLTTQALIEFQSTSRIAPAEGMLGPLTRSKIIESLLEKSIAAR